MKKILMLFVAIVCMSCGSDDDSGSSPQQITGRWANVGKTINGGAMVAHDHDCDTMSDFWDIQPNGTILFNHYGFTCELGNAFTGNWELSGNTLAVWSTFDPAGMDEEYSVVRLTETELELQHTVETGTGNAVEKLYFERE